RFPGSRSAWLPTATSKSTKTPRWSRGVISTYERRRENSFFLEEPGGAAVQRLELHLPQPAAGVGPRPRLHQLHKLLPPYPSGEGSPEYPAPALHVGPGTDVVLSVFHPRCHRHSFDVLLRAVYHTGLRPNARPPRLGGLWHVPAQHASLVRPWHGCA